MIIGIYEVREFGAVGDGKTKDTKSVQHAIDTCANAGGGTVLLTQGTFVVGTIFLRSNVTLEIQNSAVILASPDIGDYAEAVHHNRYRNEPDMDRCLFYGEDASQIVIRGYGTIDGNADAFPNEGSIYRPMMFRFLRCEHIHLEQLRLYHAAAWTTAFLDSSYIWVDRLDIRNEKRFNGDGLDFDGCSHVYVSNCNIRGTDDNLCLQSSSRAYPTEDVHITNCSFSSVCAGIRIGLKSIGMIRNVVVSNCTMKNIWREGIKIECTEGGTIEDILIQNISMRNVRRPIFILLNNRFVADDLGSSIELEEVPEIGTMERITICGLHAVDDDEMLQVHKRFDYDIMGRPEFAGIRVDAEENHKIRYLTLKDIHYRFIGGVKKERIPEQYPKVLDRLVHKTGEVSENYYPDWSRAGFMDLRNVDGLMLENLVLETLYPDEREEVILEGCLIRGDNVADAANA